MPSGILFLTPAGTSGGREGTEAPIHAGIVIPHIPAAPAIVPGIPAASAVIVVPAAHGHSFRRTGITESAVIATAA